MSFYSFEKFLTIYFPKQLQRFTDRISNIQDYIWYILQIQTVCPLTMAVLRQIHLVESKTFAHFAIIIIGMYSFFSSSKYYLSGSLVVIACFRIKHLIQKPPLKQEYKLLFSQILFDSTFKTLAFSSIDSYHQVSQNVCNLLLGYKHI